MLYSTPAQNMALEVVSFDLKHLSNNPYLLYCDVVSNAIVSDMYKCKTGMSLLPTKVVTFHIKAYLWDLCLLLTYCDIAIVYCWLVFIVDILRYSQCLQSIWPASHWYNLLWFVPAVKRSQFLKITNNSYNPSTATDKRWQWREQQWCFSCH